MNVLGLFNLQVPLSVVGVTESVFFGGGMSLRVAELGTGWTTGVVQITGITFATPSTAVVNTVTLADGDARTAGHAGTVRVISPFKYINNVSGNMAGVVTIFHFRTVPEPATVALLASAAFALGLGLRRRR